jgi:hypothetical protein
VEEPQRTTLAFPSVAGTGSFLRFSDRYTATASVAGDGHASKAITLDTTVLVRRKTEPLPAVTINSSRGGADLRGSLEGMLRVWRDRRREDTARQSTQGAN